MSAGPGANPQSPAALGMDGRLAKGEPILQAANGGATAGAFGQPLHMCAGCGKGIADRFMLQALDRLWHEDCLKCCCCDCRLGEVSNSLYIRAEKLLCKRDYFRLFGTVGECAACSKSIPGFELVMRAKTNVYHVECFACQQCNHRFCVGDRFYLCENKILCEYDYEERMMFASIGHHMLMKRHATSQSGTGTSPTTAGPTTPGTFPPLPQQQQLLHPGHFTAGKHPQQQLTMLGGLGSPKHQQQQQQQQSHDDLNNNNNNNNNSSKAGNHAAGQPQTNGALF